jgi:hypothetical protein
VEETINEINTDPNPSYPGPIHSRLHPVLTCIVHSNDASTFISRLKFIFKPFERHKIVLKLGKCKFDLRLSFAVGLFLKMVFQ